MSILKFSNSDEMPALGLGTWKSQPGEVKQAVIKAIEVGFRHIDCAAIYQNEAEIGEAISECIEKGVVSREELWITSKLWNDSHQKAHVRLGVEKTLKDLQLDYLDLYLIHWPIAFKHGTIFAQGADDYLSLEEAPLAETWGAMQELQQAALVKHIGTSNFSHKKLQHLIDLGGQWPEMNQVELHPYLQQWDLINFCHSNNIHVTAYSPLGSMDRPESFKQEGEPIPLENKTVASIAEKNGISPAQVLIRWQLQRGVSVIPKSTNAGRLKQNFETLSIELSEADMKAIKELDQHKRIIDGSFFSAPEKGYSMESLWDQN